MSAESVPEQAPLDPKFVEEFKGYLTIPAVDIDTEAIRRALEEVRNEKTES